MNARARYYRLKAAGLCVDCGRPARIPTTRCEICASRQTRAGRERAHLAVLERQAERRKNQGPRIERMLELAKHLADLARQRKENQNAGLSL